MVRRGPPRKSGVRRESIDDVLTSPREPERIADVGMDCLMSTGASVKSGRSAGYRSTHDSHMILLRSLNAIASVFEFVQ